MLKRAFLLLFLLLTIFISSAFANPIPQRKVDPNFRPMYGISYSFEQADWYGLEPREDFVKMLDEFKFDWVRLPFFWDQSIRGTESTTSTKGTKSNEDIDLSDLKWAVEEADKKGIKVIIALGAKTPYYPEYHWPKDIASKVKFTETITIDHPIAKDILNIDRKVVEELATYNNIAYWQVENEPLIGNVNKWKIDKSLIAAEVEMVRKSDLLKRPIILNHAAGGFYDKSWEELLTILKLGDVFAVNAFFKTKGTDLVTAKVFGHEIHLLWPDRLTWPVQSWLWFSPNFESIKTKVESRGIKFWVLEMQAEPYIRKLSQANGPILSFSADDINAADLFLRSYKIESIGLWGIHFWQYREENGDSSWIEASKAIVNN